MNWLYAIYAFVIGVVDVKSGMRLIKQNGWNQWVGFSSLIIGVVAFVSGFQSLMGFYVNPIMLLLPLVFAGFVITVESWKDVQNGGIGAWFVALYNSFAWITNLIQLLALLNENRRD